MPYVETYPYRIEIANHILRSIDIRVSENVHRLTVDSYDANNALIKTEVIELPIFDISNQVIMPASWPENWPTGLDLYQYLEQAFYRRLNEEKPWIIGPGEVM